MAATKCGGQLYGDSETIKVPAYGLPSRWAIHLDRFGIAKDLLIGLVAPRSLLGARTKKGKICRTKKSP